MLLPLILPGIITGLSLLMLFREADVKLSLLTIVLGHGTALISVATTEVFAGLQKLDRAQEEASLDLGANYWQTFWRVTLPNLRLSIIGAALLIFTLSMDEIAVSFFLIGRDNTLPLEIWGRLRRGITPEINAISTIIFVFSLAAIVDLVPAAQGTEADIWCCSAGKSRLSSRCIERRGTAPARAVRSQSKLRLALCRTRTIAGAPLRRTAEDGRSPTWHCVRN